MLQTALTILTYVRSSMHHCLNWRRRSKSNALFFALDWYKSICSHISFDVFSFSPYSVIYNLDEKAGRKEGRYIGKRKRKPKATLSISQLLQAITNTICTVAHNFLSRGPHRTREHVSKWRCLQNFRNLLLYP